MNACQSCGAVLAGDTRFCPSCGSANKLARGIFVSAPEDSGAVVAMSSPANIETKIMATNLVGALAYLAGLATGIMFLILEPYKSNSFVRFHSFQSIFLNVTWVAFWILWLILSAALTPWTAGVFAVIDLPLTLIFTLAGFGIWAFLMYQAYQQKLFKLPILGRLASHRAGVRL